MKLVTPLIICFLTTCVVSFTLLGGQTMPEAVERLLRLKDFIALKPDEIPDFNTKGAITFHPAGQKDRLMLVQGLVRQIPNLPGKERTDIIIRLSLLPNPEMAYEAALSSTTSQRIYPDGAGMPQGSWTGLPIGKKSWATAPDPKAQPAPGIGTASLVVWDDKLALEVEVNYQPIGGPKAKTAIFLPIAKEDLELGELAARLILAKAHLVLLGWRDLPTVRLVANGKDLEGKRTKEGAVFVPIQALLKGLGGESGEEVRGHLGFMGRQEGCDAHRGEGAVGGEREGCFEIADIVGWEGGVGRGGRDSERLRVSDEMGEREVGVG
jgi:hypothetical protein